MSDRLLELDIDRYVVRKALGEDDLPEITNHLLSLNKDQIYDLGIVLGVSHRKLRAMEDSRRFRDDVIIAWLRREDQVEKRGIISWGALVNALRQPRMGQNGIARDIVRREIR